MIKPYYQDEWVTIYNMDCREGMKEIPDGSIDLVLTDPPYGIDIANNPFRQRFQKADWDNEIPTQDVFNEIFRISKEQIIWGGNYFPLPITQGFLVWDKLQPQNFSSAMCEMAWISKKMPAKIFRRWVVSFEKCHPTQKPEELIAWCLSLFPESQTILDPFLGSGTTAYCAKKLNRHCIGFEISEKYCEIAAKRCSQSVINFEEAKIVKIKNGVLL